jgi:hypothetical protein
VTGRYVLNFPQQTGHCRRVRVSAVVLECHLNSAVLAFESRAQCDAAETEWNKKARERGHQILIEKTVYGATYECLPDTVGPRGAKR